CMYTGVARNFYSGWACIYSVCFQGSSQSFLKKDCYCPAFYIYYCSFGAPLVCHSMVGYEDQADDGYYLDEPAGSFEQDLVYALDAG
ncbi:hypothetical protein NDU88_008371, partial [Pleurodeles waltl]